MNSITRVPLCSPDLPLASRGVQATEGTAGDEVLREKAVVFTALPSPCG